MEEHDNDTFIDGLTESRRSVLKKGAAATGAVALGASGTALAQDDGGDDVAGEGWKALIFVSQFNPNGRFAIVSDVVEWVPNFGEVQDNWFSNYNTYQIRWQNSDNVVPLFVAADAPIGEFDEELGFIADEEDPNQPQLYEMDREYTLFGDSPRLLTVNVSPVGEEEENQILENDDWWLDEDGEETPVETETPAGNGNQTNAGG